MDAPNAPLSAFVSRSVLLLCWLSRSCSHICTWPLSRSSRGARGLWLCGRRALLYERVRYTTCGFRLFIVVCKLQYMVVISCTYDILLPDEKMWPHHHNDLTMHSRASIVRSVQAFQSLQCLSTTGALNR